MAENNWKDKLRQTMSEYKETPPEGLWEGIEGAIAPRAGGGFWAWLTGRPGLWPVWATAGVAAALGAVLLLRTPAPPADPGKPEVATVESGEPSDPTVVPEDTSGPGSPASTDVDSPAMPAGPAVTPGRSGHRSALAGLTDTTTQAEDILVPAVQDEVEAQEPGTEEDAPAVAPHQTGEDSQAAPDEGGDAPEKQDAPSVRTGYPDPFAPSRVPLRKTIRRSRPLLAAALTGGSAPGGGTTVSSNAYGFATPSGRDFADPSAVSPKMAMLGRNKSVQTDISHRQDYQFGLLLDYSFSEHWGIESGVLFTGLTSESKSTTGTITTTKREKFTYLGIPLRVVYTPFNYKSLAVYLSAGPAAEYGLASSWESRDLVGDKEMNAKSDSARPGDWIFSASLNAGVQWQPWQYGAFFIQPGVVGRLPNEDSPQSYYTAHPVSFQLSAGYKITF